MLGQRIENEALSAWAENAARGLKVGGRCRGRATERRIRGALSYLAQYEHSGEGDEGALRWLRDNLWFLRTLGEDTAEAFAHTKHLRKCEGKPRPCAAAEALLQSGFPPDAQRCHLFLEGFQNRLLLNEQELSLFPAALCCELLLSLCVLLRSGKAEEKSVGELVTALRFCANAHWGRLLEKINRSEGIFLRDPAGVYEQMDEESRRDYRHRLETLSRRRGVEESVLAERILRESTERGVHLGFVLYEGERLREGGLYIAANVLLTAFLSLLGGFLLHAPEGALLMLLPMSECTKTLLDFLLAPLTPPRRLPRLSLKAGVPPEGRTLCAISLLLGSEEEGKKAVERMGEYRCANRDCGRELLIGLLCDLPESDKPESAEDSELLQKLAHEVEELNLRMGGGFFLLSRPRRQDAINGGYRGYERKRGALLALSALIVEGQSELMVLAGDESQLHDIRFILALDSDTRLTPQSARSLIGAMLHPMNRCVLDEARGIVTGGYGILQPRLATELHSSGKSDFARFFSAQGGMSAYRGCAGELYFDRFRSGGFSGKGLIDPRALLCVSRSHIPEGQVLSHDALEGAFLRAGLLEDVELTDSFPSSPLSYGRRQKRWTRGDWQNLPWLFGRGQLLRPIERWRLFDSLRRSLVDAGVLAALLSGFFLTEKLLFVGIIGIVTLFFRFFLYMMSSALQREENVRYRLLSRILHGCAGAFTRTLLLLLLLPWTAGIGLGSALLALWRLYGTKRNLLQWETAAESDRRGNDFRCYLRSMGFSLSVGLLCLLSPSIFGKAAGLLWLFSPLCLYGLSQERKGEKPLSAADRDYLMQRARELWRWFERFCDRENHYLPPDNLQELPAVGLAHRTSPTNMGLMLVSALCALDLELCSRCTFQTLVSHTLDSLEQLPKWHGHIYNWVDTRSLRVLEPAYVSTVDSGNLAAALTVLSAGLEDYGFSVLSKRALRLRDAMDFSMLYDEERELFHIGYSVREQRCDENHYDLLESEQRLCAYYAIASAQVSVEHWGALSRGSVEFDGYRGCASWSGSMFEYLMPELFLPLEPDSLLAESAKFCVYVQSRYRYGRARLWGKSESAFFSLDAALNYRYKAHGVQALSLCRSMNAEQVVAPYASFLALCVKRDKALANLRRLEAAGALGPWGFWDAMDFTPERCQREGKVVRCVMAHHMGMSMAALTNCLMDNILQKRFLREPSMAAYRTLLQERVPLGGPLLHRRSIHLPLRPLSERDSLFTRKGQNPVSTGGTVHALSNGSYHLLLTESALSRAHWEGLLPYRTPESEPGECRGIECFLELDGERFSLLPCAESVGRFRWEFRSSEAVFFGERGALRWEMRISVSESECSEMRELKLRGLPESARAAVYWGFEPVLSSPEALRSGRSYARLGLKCERREGGFLVSRLPRGEESAAYLACVLRGEAEFCPDFLLFPRRSRQGRMQNAEGWQSAAFCTLRQVLKPQKGYGESCLVLAVGREAEQTLAAAKHSMEHPRAASMTDSAARLLGMDGTDVRQALTLLQELVFPHLCEEARLLRADARQSALWPWGISGDLPIVALFLREESLRNAALAVKHHSLLACCGVSYDLVFLSDEAGEYRPGPRLALEELLRRLGQEGRIGQKGGCHFVDSAARDVVLTNCAYVYKDSGRIERDTLRLSAEAEPVRELLAPLCENSLRPCEESWGEDDSYVLTLRGLLPERSRCQMLSNPDFGCLFNECGCVGLWYRNARECPLMPPCNDPFADFAPEKLEAKLGGRWVSLFAQKGEDCLVRYGAGYAQWEKSVGGVSLRLTATVPLGQNERIYRIESSESVEIRWSLPLQLSPEGRDRSFCTLSEEGGALVARSRRCALPGVSLRARASVPWLSHNADSVPARSALPVMEGHFLAEGDTLLRMGVGELSVEAESAAETTEAWRSLLAPLHVESGRAELDRLVRTWSPYQALCGRLWGRCSMDQSGGAIGFRDQLQDAVNLMALDPGLCRRQLLLCAEHMYEEGDVQHWWHPLATKPDRGCRSRCSDDLLWLVWALCEYVERSGEREICAEEAGYLRSLPLTKDERSRYELPELSGERDTLLNHCRRALGLALSRGKGQHGLLLMLSGDWNDGLDDMGEGAESVWLSFFWCRCAFSFADLLDSLDEEGGEALRQEARLLLGSCEECWNGSYYPRAYYGNGQQLGTVDAIVQAFAALCSEVDSDHARLALDTAMHALYNREHRLLRLSAEPYGSEHAPGYISSYGPGFRENGGQYTHAALFLGYAMLKNARKDEAWQLLRCATAIGRGAEYGLGPYLIPADISANPRCIGRGGWDWYTGSAGWFLRLGRMLIASEEEG